MDLSFEHVCQMIHSEWFDDGSIRTFTRSRTTPYLQLTLILIWKWLNWIFPNKNDNRKLFLDLSNLKSLKNIWIICSTPETRNLTIESQSEFYLWSRKIKKLLWCSKKWTHFWIFSLHQNMPMMTFQSYSLFGSLFYLEKWCVL